MIRIVQIIVSFLASAILFLGCTKENSSYGSVDAAFLSVNGPNSGSVNQDNFFTVTAFGNTGCAQSITCSAIQEGKTITIKAKVNYHVGACTQSTVTVTDQYVFKTLKSGTYTLLFQKEAGDYFTKTIVIQ